MRNYNIDKNEVVVVASERDKPHATNLCGAKTRSGNPCKNYAMANGRCRMHGGRSTGPKDKTKLNKNKNSEKHGLYSKYLPDETNDIIDMVNKQSPIDILWEQITIQVATIIRSQKIMYVKDQEDFDITMESSGVDGETKAYATAGDKQAAFLQAQSRAMTTLNGMIKQYQDMCNSDIVTETQKARLKQIQSNVKKIEKDLDSDIDKPIEIEIVSRSDKDGSN